MDGWMGGWGDLSSSLPLSTPPPHASGLVVRPTGRREGRLAGRNANDALRIEAAALKRDHANTDTPSTILQILIEKW